MVWFLFFVYFRVSLGVHGSAYGWLSPSPSIVWQVSLETGRLTNSCTLHLYTDPVNRVVWPVRKETDFASKVPERESNSSYTARIDPFPSALSTRPTLLPSLYWLLGVAIVSFANSETPSKKEAETVTMHKAFSIICGRHNGERKIGRKGRKKRARDKNFPMRRNNKTARHA